MKKRLSSPFTFFYKVIFPCLWVCIGLVAVVRIFMELSGLEAFGVLIFIALIEGILGIYYWSKYFTLKQVSLDDQFLYVSNYIEQIEIPLILVDSVESTGGSFGRFPPLVIVTLKASSDLGDEIKFIPGFYYKEVVELLRRKIE